MEAYNELVLSIWYHALGSDDCVVVKRLLKSHPYLVWEGWKDSPKRNRFGKLLEKPVMGKHWSGKTALHVAANRGSLELVTSVVDMFTCNHEGEWLLADSGNKEGMFASPRSRRAESEVRTLGGLLAQKDGELQLEALACAAIKGCPDVTKVLMAASLKCNSNPYDVQSRRIKPREKSIRVQEIPEQERSMGVQLRGITEKVMASLTADERSTIETQYSLDKTLPFEDYLLRCSFTSTSIDAELSKKVQNEVLETAYSESGVRAYELKEFLIDKLGSKKSRAEEASSSVSCFIVQEACAEGEQVSNANDLRGQVRKVTRQVMAGMSMEDRVTIKCAYLRNQEFNFLDIEEYFFPFTFSRWRDQDQSINKGREELWKRIDGADPDFPELKKFLLVELCDGCGRSTLHHASSQRDIELFLSVVPKGEDYANWVNPRDGAGRTPLYMAAASGNGAALRALIKDYRVDVNAQFPLEYYAYSMWGYSLSTRNGFQTPRETNVTALQIAIILKRRLSVEILMEDDNKDRREEYRLDLTCEYYLRWGQVLYALEPLALAVWVGDVTIVELLLKDSRVRDPGRPSKWWGEREPMKPSKRKPPALHIAAYIGKFDLVKVFLDTRGADELYDPFVMDENGNTAMHHVTRGRDDPFVYHLLHLVRPADAPVFRPPTEPKNGDPERVKKRVIERQGCVGLLLQAGLDVWTTNRWDQSPNPQKTSPEFLQWWYDKLAKETLEEQNTLNAAANAISVTAALVATTSYVGPLQPPLGYESNAAGLPSEIQVARAWVRMFIACDTISFYLAVGAIMLAIIPALPIPQQRVRMEIKHTRRIVTFAVAFLFPSVISILLAFGASSMAVIPSQDDGLKISTSVVGGLLCLLVIFIFSIRILGLVLHRSGKVKKLYGDSIFLDEIVSSRWRESCAGKTFDNWEASMRRAFRRWKHCTEQSRWIGKVHFSKTEHVERSETG